MHVSTNRHILDPLDLSRFFQNHPRLETERLVLRELTLADATAIHAYYADPECKHFQGGKIAKTLGETVEIIRQVAEEFAIGKAFLLGVERKSDGNIIGACDLHHLSPKDHRMEIGYGLARAYWGHGYMTEAVREVIRFAFEEMGFHRIEAECETENTRAARVAERCAMVLEATMRENEIMRGHFVSNKLYAIVRN